MATFPTIYVHGTTVQTPVVGDLTDSISQNPTIRSQFDGGYSATRARYTRIARMWNVTFRGVSKANKNTIKAFEDARLVGSESFSWTNPENSTSYTVRFMGPVSYTPWQHANYARFDISFVLEVV